MNATIAKTTLEEVCSNVADTVAKMPKRTLAFFSGLFATGAAMAITAPAADSFGYDLYDILVLQGVQGAPGFVIGVLGIGYSALQLNSGNWKLPVLGVLGSSAVLRADDITTTLGFMI